jgi:hypothetical protein
MTRCISLVVGLGLLFAASAGAQQSPAAPATAVRIVELEAQIAQLTQQINQLRTNRPADVRWMAPHSTAPNVQAPPSSLQRTFAIASIEAGCPPGAVCLVVRCDAPHSR